MPEIELFTDPACPFAFSAEPIRQRLRWHYEGLSWKTAMIALTREQGEAEKLAEGAPTLQRKFGMPIDPAPYPRPASSEPACRAVVATRLNAPDRADALLRRLRVAVMKGGLIDEPELISAAAAEAGVDPAELGSWSRSPSVATALEEDASAARTPAAPALALPHKLGGPPGQPRYTAPTYVFGGAVVPGFNPIEAYEAVIANRAPELFRRPPPESVDELLEWAPEPLATAEVAMVMACSIEQAREELRPIAQWEPAGRDGYWTTS